MAGPEKSEGAFRTIREVADWLGVPTHVLRFWESKFDQIAPVKGAGGRRYYRPEDMRLLGGIKVMLHDRGMPIRGVSQRIDADGAEAVMALSPDLDMPDTAAAPKTRRVIRQGEDDTVPETIGALAKGKASAPEPDRIDPSPRIDPRPEPDEPDPVQPGDDEPSDQLGDETDVPQPADGPVEEPLDGSGQPDAPPTEGDGRVAPDTDPDVAPEPDIALERKPAPASRPFPLPDLAAPEPTAPVDGDVPTTVSSDAAPAPSDAHVTDPAAREEESISAPRAIVVRPENQRRLRRVIRKLRGLIEEVEGEVRETERTGTDE